MATRKTLFGVPRTLLRDLSVILGISMAVTMASLLFGWDQAIAVAITRASPTLDAYAELIGSICGVWLPIGTVIAACVPALRKRYRSLVIIASVWAATVFIGHNMLIANLKQVSSRPRPFQTTLLGGHEAFAPPLTLPLHFKQGTYNSFPSSAAALGFSLASSYFVLRRRQRKLALTILVIGLFCGSTAGLARMIIGKHFMTDVLWSGAVMLSVASIASHITLRWRTTT